MNWTMDRRLLASNGRVANEKLRGKVTAGRFVASTRYMVVASISQFYLLPILRGSEIVNLHLEKLLIAFQLQTDLPSEVQHVTGM